MKKIYIKNYKGFKEEVINLLEGYSFAILNNK